MWRLELGAQTLIERLEWREGCCVVPFQCSHFPEKFCSNHRPVYKSQGCLLICNHVIKKYPRFLKREEKRSANTAVLKFFTYMWNLKTNTN